MCFFYVKGNQMILNITYTNYIESVKIIKPYIVQLHWFLSEVKPSKIKPGPNTEWKIQVKYQVLQHSEIAISILHEEKIISRPFSIFQLQGKFALHPFCEFVILKSLDELIICLKKLFTKVLNIIST